MAVKNILLTSSLLNPRGAERMILQLAIRLDKGKYNVKVLCLRKETPFMDEFVEAGVDIRSLGMTRYFQLGPLAELYRFIRREKIDLVHTHLYRDAIYGRVLGKMAGTAAVVSTLHNSYVWRSKAQLLLDRITSHWADKIVAVSDAVRRYAIENEHIPPVKIMTIYNGIETLGFRIPPREVSELKRKLGFSPHELVIGSIGELTRQKGYRYLLESAPAILKEHPEVRFLIAGDGDLKTELKAQAERAGVSQKVSFLGYREDIPAVLNIFDIFVLPSLWEGLPVVLIEAMAAGKPIVASDVDGNVEVIGEKEAGIAVPPRNPGALSEAILALIRTPSRRERMGRKGRERAEKIFDVRIMVRKYEELYDLIFAPPIKASGRGAKIRV